MKRRRWEQRIRLGSAVGVLGLALFASLGAAAVERLPPSPYDILHSQDLETPVLDAVSYCAPNGLDAALDPILEQADALEWKVALEMLHEWADALDRPGPERVVLESVLHSRSVDDREGLLLAEERFRSLLRRPGLADQGLCLRLELARVLLLLSREAEASAQLSRAERILDERGAPSRRAEELALYRAEISYARGRRFEAHLMYRKLARAENARLALAARLRLTDLSFDAGKLDNVSLEYEALLPRASAFGASTAGWALRASEAALDSKDPGGALRWLESFLEEGPERDARDAAEIRLADLDVVFEDPLRARKRLSTITGRRRGDEIGALAAVRAIDLGVSAGSPDQRLQVLLKVLREQRRGVRRYALGVMMEELAHRGDLDAALAVATRLAYEGLDPVVSPRYNEVLDDLLERVSSDNRGEEGCRELIRALGGRYGILIERSSRTAPFARVGDCFEKMELPWLAAKVYRSITRRFGAAGAQRIALPLARSSLAIGEVTLARRVATAALEDPDEHVEAWKAIVAEADFVDGRYRESARGLRSILDAPDVFHERAKLVRILALTLAESRELIDARFIAERVPDWLDEGELQPGARASMIEAVMLAAHAYRQAGSLKRALPLYRAVDRHAEAGAVRSSARFWLGMATAPDPPEGSAWGDEPELTLGSPWARYALFERHFDPLWEAYSGSIRSPSIQPRSIRSKASQ